MPDLTEAAGTPTLDAQLLKLADDIEQAMAGSPEFIGPTGLRFNVADRIRSLLAGSKASPQYGVSWISQEPKLFDRLDAALDELSADNRYFRNSRLLERTITVWRPRPETGNPGWARATAPTPTF
jgi:hypothetical protein